MQMRKMDFLAFFFCDKKQKSQGNWLFNEGKMNFVFICLAREQILRSTHAKQRAML
ncbi:hypothetical protein HNQ34_000611 [Anoxybacillus tepidamans]|uniref:Uncharacterized protein n=1 Tax=Anoxybacteroides tepidamans TaxID=265948 RepID=A0A7W8MTU2_9BACL|nr:hypothetical protein [Anoxybacillus tepidamans]